MATVAQAAGRLSFDELCPDNTGRPSSEDSGVGSWLSEAFAVWLSDSTRQPNFLDSGAGRRR